MGRRKYSEHAVIQVDQRAGSRHAKIADVVDVQTAVANIENRRGLQGLDRMTESYSSGTREQKDAARIFPRDTTSPLGHPKKDRRLLDPDALRTPMSKRQRLERLHAEKEVSSWHTEQQERAMRAMTGNPQVWNDLNGSLAESKGDIDALSPQQITHIRTIDGMIQDYEGVNDRGHRVYMNLEMPSYINSSNVESFVKSYMPEGTSVDFDQFTAGSHNLYEISDNTSPRTVAVEIHTRRGMFIGEPGKSKSNGHLLPRGMHLEVADVHKATFVRPDGSRGERVLIQLVDPAAEDTPGTDN
ncbi:hypothetical protein [Luteococcus sp.]|uniref:hypothetical protein n=1 Tax=Luteococcus sp. TaxID=1969402 RepID=UPI003736991D